MGNSLDDSQYLSLSTLKKDGTAVATPVWFAKTNHTLYFFTAGSAGKVKRIHNFPAIRVAVCNVSGKVSGDWFNAEARILQDSDDISRAYNALLKKYGWKIKLLDFFSRLGGKIDKRAFIEATLEIETTLEQKTTESAHPTIKPESIPTHRSFDHCR